MRGFIVAAALAVCLLIPKVQADVVTSIAPAVSVGVGLASNPITVQPTFVPFGEGLYLSTGNAATANWSFDWDVTVKPDPFVSAVFGFTNTSPITQTFVINVTLPIFPPQVPFTLMGGSIGVTLTDSNFNGVATVSSAPGVDVYTGQIDGVGVLPLMDDPFSLSVTFPGQTVTTSDIDGLPGPTLPGPAALTSIGISHTFRLTAGDKVAFTSFFIVEAVPEVGTIGMMGAGVILAGALGIARRRRSST